MTEIKSFEIVESDLPAVAAEILSFGKSETIFLFSGQMGSGKSALIFELCRKLGVGSNLSSPTFSIVNRYGTLENKTIFHFDLYRLKSLSECMHIGLEEYLQSGNHCFIEWPEIAMVLMPPHSIHIQINVLDGEKRRLSVARLP